MGRRGGSGFWGWATITFTSERGVIPKIEKAKRGSCKYVYWLDVALKIKRKVGGESYAAFSVII